MKRVPAHHRSPGRISGSTHTRSSCPGRYLAHDPTRTEVALPAAELAGARVDVLEKERGLLRYFGNRPQEYAVGVAMDPATGSYHTVKNSVVIIDD